MHHKQVIMLAAVARNGVIGHKGKLPWHDPEDLKWFRQKTLDHSVIVGRKTYRHLPKLDRREVIVVTAAYINDDSVKRAEHLQLAIEIASSNPVFIIGGQSIFKQGWRFADNIEINIIDARPEGDTYFPPPDPLNLAYVLDSDKW